MTMLPICLAATSCSSHSQITLQGGLQPWSYRGVLGVRSILGKRVAVSSCNVNHVQGASFETDATAFLYSNFSDRREQTPTLGFGNRNDNFLNFVSSGKEQLIDLGHRITEDANILDSMEDPQTVRIGDVIQGETASSSDLLSINEDSLSKVKADTGDVFSGVNESLNDSVVIVKSFVTSSLDDANKSVNNAISQVVSSVDRIKELAYSQLAGLSSDLSEASNAAGKASVDLLRQAIVQIEGSLDQGATYVVYAYGSAKELLPSEVQNAVNLSEEWVGKISRPVGTILEQIYVAVSEVEKILGLDPNDPILHLVLFVGTSTALWAFYLSITYGGYAGDLSPESTMDLLRGKENVVLVDVRPEVLREKDGIPDLRRAARFRYAHVTLPVVDSSIKQLLNSGKDLDDSLTATIIRNLKIVQDRSKVVVMDADGTRSKGIARALRKLGIKQPYLVQGGFRSWVKEGLRVKELKPETTLTTLNEEAEAILEEISPTPLGVIGYGMGFVAASYALLEWERTLQLIGVIGLAQSIYRRVASYEGADDFKQDLRLLLTPVRAGRQAISWAAGKLETNGIGLPTSPSLPDVQNRVLQAAAKHESQPSNGAGNPELPPDPAPAANESVDLSEA